MQIDQQIVIPVSAFLSFIGAFIIFGLGQLFIAIWVASKLNTKVGLLANTLESLERDVKSLVKFDTKIEVLHERMNQSQADRSRIWEAVVDVRRTVSTIQNRNTLRDGQ